MHVIKSVKQMFILQITDRLMIHSIWQICYVILKSIYRLIVEIYMTLTSIFQKHKANKRWICIHFSVASDCKSSESFVFKSTFSQVLDALILFGLNERKSRTHQSVSSFNRTFKTLFNFSTKQVINLCSTTLKFYNSRLNRARTLSWNYGRSSRTIHA